MASSLPAVVGGVEPELTVTAAAAVPVDDDTVSTAAAPAADDRPEYSSAATPMSAVRLVVAVTTSGVPPPWLIERGPHRHLGGVGGHEPEDLGVDVAGAVGDRGGGRRRRSPHADLDDHPVAGDDRGHRGGLAWSC